MAIEDWPREARGFLPPWFDLEPYEAAREWSPGRWSQELSDRSWLFDLLSNPPSETIEEDSYACFGFPDKKSYIDDLKRRFDSLTKSDEEAFDDFKKGSIEHDRNLFYPVKTLTAYSATILYGRLKGFCEDFCGPPMLAGEIDSMICVKPTCLSFTPDPMFLPYDAIIKGGASPDHHYVTVNLGLPDHILVDYFKRWLKSERNRLDVPNPKPFTYSRKKRADPDGKPKQGEKRVLSKSDFEKWVDWRVLPYLDISVWLLIEGEEEGPPPRIWESILFPAHKDNSKQPLFSDMKRLAEWLMEDRDVYGLLRAAEPSPVTK